MFKSGLFLLRGAPFKCGISPAHSHLQPLSVGSASSLPWGSFNYQVRHLNLHEYQSKNLLRQFGLNVQKGSHTATSDGAFQIAQTLKKEGAQEIVLKCQVLAGGRGKGTLSSGLQGGVKVCEDPAKVKAFADQMLGYTLKTHQTTQEGEKVKEVLVLQSVNIQKEFYVALVLDRSVNGPALIISPYGGMDIEKVAEEHPHAVTVIPIDIRKGLTKTDLEKATKALFSTESFPLSIQLEMMDQLTKLYQLFIKCDATMVEINPFAFVQNGELKSNVTSEVTSDSNSANPNLICIDAKMQFDDSAAFRHPDLFAMEDKETHDSREIAAQNAGLTFVSMDGDIGCMVNGAGLAMATMDMIQKFGRTPANFLDLGGGVAVEQVKEAFQILTQDNQVKAIFINVFAGISRCDVIAQGILEACKTINLKIPIVIRMCGTQVEKGKEILKGSNLNLHVCDDFEEAAKKVCQL